MSFDYLESFGKGALEAGVGTFVALLVGSYFGVTNPSSMIMGLPLIVPTVVIGSTVGGIINVALRS